MNFENANLSPIFLNTWKKFRQWFQLVIDEAVQRMANESNTNKKGGPPEADRLNMQGD